ncbi:LANO_0H10726g1_1 [Lachancea nothofagi CBS 11611]|uniref:Large ribosomal subunit protein mL67 n=1 Tax=Lachancea nothofagi CBS 11611 TaxID=1266666 RepID=A0A1G4KMG4_9SACH|nr:LANO_0H10726g1_1 [Lachancea nothofagi CBS 11611]
MVAPTRFRTAKWLHKAGFAPQVFLFRNLESGQVIYSQLPVFTHHQIDSLFKRPDWANKKPSTRRDIWRCMAVVDLPNYEQGVQTYQNLCRLRYLRDVAEVKKADSLRKKNEFGHVWYSAQFRPTYTQEAVADLKEALLKAQVGSAQIHWEDQWRMGDLEKHWTPILPQLKHSVLSRIGNSAREESAILRELGDRAKLEFVKLSNQETAASELSV